MEETVSQASDSPAVAALFMDPVGVTANFGLQEGMFVSDFGVGPGHFTIVIAKIVGPDGRVAAIDVQSEKLEHLKARSDAEDLDNIDFIRADLEQFRGTGLDDESQDFVLIANVLYESKQKDKIIAEAQRVMKPGAIICIIDWQKGVGGVGPADALRSNDAEMRAIVEQGGLALQGTIPVDAFHYGLMFKKA